MNKSKVAILIPYYGGYDVEHFHCVLAVKDLWKSEGISIFPIHTCPYIDLARSLLVAKAYLDKPDLDCVVFIDHDIIFDAHDIERMVDMLMSRDDIDVLGAGYSMRGPGAKMIGAIQPGVVPEGTGIGFFDAPGAGPFPALYTGFGFTAIKTRVFERLNSICPEMKCGWAWPVRPYFALMLDDNIYRGEDVSFCERAKRTGSKIFIDTRIRVLHKGSYKYKLEDMGWVIPSVGALTITPSDLENSGLPMMEHLASNKVAAE